ncbi:MAG TPA: hypothetical protein VKV69_14575, partial [Actinomycetota bacterium]|nr:hypothetical protein [Actinomycetota bacterium]
GTGAPLLHMDEGWATDVRAKLVGYEIGAGAWIGKALREQPRAALRFLRARIRLQGATIAHAKANGDESLSRSAFAGALTRGLIAGLKMKPWKAERAGR